MHGLWVVICGPQLIETIMNYVLGTLIYPIRRLA